MEERGRSARLVRASRIGFSLPAIDTTAFRGRAREQRKTSWACRGNCGDFVDTFVLAIRLACSEKPETLPPTAMSDTSDAVCPGGPRFKIDLRATFHDQAERVARERGLGFGAESGIGIAVDERVFSLQRGQNGAAPESNRPSVGLPRRTGFEDLARSA
jgi:hypothetical protein